MQVQTLYNGAPTAYARVPTVFEAVNRTTPQPPAPDAPPVLPELQIPDDKWGQVQMMADRTRQMCEIEHEIMLLLDRRSLLSRRLIDGAKRKDERVVQEATRDWMTSEAKLAKIWQAYEPYAAERLGVLRQLGVINPA